MGWKYNPFTDELDRTELPGDGDTNQRVTKNDAGACGVSWQDKGFSYLTDELGNALTDELGNALEGKDTVDARLLVNTDISTRELTFADSPYSVMTGDERIYIDATDGNVIVDLIPLSLAPIKAIHIQKTDSSSNTVTITAVDSDTINGSSTKVISSQDVDHELIPVSEWRLS